MDSLQEILEPAHSRIAHEDIQSSKGLHGLRYKFSPSLGLRHVAGHRDELVFFSSDNVAHILSQCLDERVLLGASQVVDGYFRTVAEIFQGDCLRKEGPY